MTMIEIQATVSKYTTMFDDKSSVYFAQWCSKSKLDLSQAAVERKISKATDGRKIRHRKLYVLDAKLHDDVAKGIKEYIPRYHEHLKKMKKVGCTIIGYCRKSRTIEDDETRVRLLQRMVNLMRTRSLVDKAFVSPYSAAGDEISTRDFYNKFNMASLEDVAGTTQDLISFLAVTPKVSLVVLDFAGLTTNTKDLKQFISKSGEKATTNGYDEQQYPKSREYYSRSIATATQSQNIQPRAAIE
ncbi:hypothetical protein DFQ29_001022 [Apophysomyces sp. BC1021]|nr:hypothetical protein DFQ29_001022 [Apophysomyces sp. BC1021]